MTDDRDRSPEGRFKYLAERRVTKALRAISSVENLADTKNYRYEEKQVNEIVSALEGAVNQLEEGFRRSMREKGSSFSFDKI